MAQAFNSFARIAIVMVAAVTAAAPASADSISDTFDAGAQGWSAYSFGYFTPFQQPNFSTSFGGSSAVTWTPNFGNPGGSIQIVDPDGGAEYFVAGADFLGNQSDVENQLLIFNEAEVNLNPALNLADPPDPLVALTNGTMTLVYDNTFKPPSSEGWSNYAVPLGPGAGWFEQSVDSGNAATAGDFSAVMSDLTGVYILADWYIGTDTTAIDNVSFTPEPGTWSTFLLGGSILAFGLYRCRASNKRVR